MCSKLNIKAPELGLGGGHCVFIVNLKHRCTLA